MIGFEGIQVLDVTGPLEVFSCASRLLMTQGLADEPAYDVVVAAREAGPVTCSSGLVLMARVAWRDLPVVDTLLVSGGIGVERVLEAPALEAPAPFLFEWLRTQAPRARRYGSVCTGALLLAKAGLLRDRRVTTHSLYFAELTALEPSAHIDTDAVFVRDGALWTSAGVMAGMDMALAMVEEDWGRKLALQVTRVLVMHAKRHGGAPRHSAVLASQEQGMQGRFGRLAGWIAANLEAELSIEALAKQADISPRHFARCFHEELGTTPAKFVERIRFEAAQQLLADGDMTLETIAARCGFGSPETLRRVFIRRAGVSPAAYRARLRRETVGET
jgi:transcriptional regulator GlxA family with amidase domain